MRWSREIRRKWHPARRELCRRRTNSPPTPSGSEIARERNSYGPHFGLAAVFRDGCDKTRDARGVQPVLTTTTAGRAASPSLFAVSGADWMGDPALAHEVFGPMGLIVLVEDFAQMLQIARSLDGQLTCTLHMDDADAGDALALLPVLERKAGRILANAFPTGVEVCDSMVHGGPYPASTNFGATSVGTMSIRRWLRPVCY